MRKTRIMRKKVLTGYSRFLFTMCCMALLLAGCASPLTGSTSPVLSPTPTQTAVVVRTVTPKSDVNGFSSEAILRERLAKVQTIMQGMSLEQKLGQLIVVEYSGNSYQGSGLREMITQQYVGGFMYQESNRNFDPPYNIAANVDTISVQAMKDAQIPLIIATDQEGGLVNRLYKFHGPLPSAQAMAASGDPHMILNQGAQGAKWMLELGINADLAPVVDVHTVERPIL